MKALLDQEFSSVGFGYSGLSRGYWEHNGQAIKSVSV